MKRKPNLPPGAEYLGNGPVSTVFSWNGKMYRFGQNHRGGTIYVAHPNADKLLNRAYQRRHKRRRSK